jgi:hypothetical protein
MLVNLSALLLLSRRNSLDHAVIVGQLFERSNVYGEQLAGAKPPSRRQRLGGHLNIGATGGLGDAPRQDHAGGPADDAHLNLRPSSFPQQSRGGQGLGGGATRGAPCEPRRGRLGGAQADAALATTRARCAGLTDRLYRAQAGPDQVSGALVLWARHRV